MLSSFKVTIKKQTQETRLFFFLNKCKTSFSDFVGLQHKSSLPARSTFVQVTQFILYHVPQPVRAVLSVFQLLHVIL